MVMQDSLSGKILWYKYVDKETLADYHNGVNWIESNGYLIQGIVCDGFKGLMQSFSQYPVQFCNFHQAAIVRRYLTKEPKLMASKELKSIMYLMKQTDKESFIGLFDDWYCKWKVFLSEKNQDTNQYIHRRLRSACSSLRRNMTYLWTWYDYIDLNIPATNNMLEGFFEHLKNKLNFQLGFPKNIKKYSLMSMLKGTIKK